jgi:hypothetical protein
LVALILKLQGKAPSGQQYKALIGLGGNCDLEVIEDDGGSPVNLCSPAKAAQLVRQKRARYLDHKSLFDNFNGVVSATGHDLGYLSDVELIVYPIGVNGKPSPHGFPIVVHVVSEYESDSVLIGT